MQDTSNNKLKMDIKKVSSINVNHKYVFFMCPNIKKGLYQDLIKSKVVIWSLGYE